MNNQDKEVLYYLEAKKRLRKLKTFYVHLALYIVVVAFVIWNLVIIEDTVYTDTILAINYSTLFIWGLFIVIHGIKTYKNNIIFTKKWENKKLEQFLGEQQNRWE